MKKRKKTRMEIAIEKAERDLDRELNTQTPLIYGSASIALRRYWGWGAQRIQKCINNIVREIAVWKHLQEFGGNDPFWADGCNMNLTRNHILSYKREIREICEENNLALPEEYYLPTPPEVENNYMASLEQKERVERLRKQGTKITRKKTEYDLGQQSLF